MLSWQGRGRAPGRGEDHHHSPDGGQEHLRGERGDGARQQNCQVRGGADIILILQIIVSMSSLLPLLTCFCLHCKVSKYFHRPSTFPMN